MKPYGTKTGRCQPSSNQYLFAIDKTFRRLIQPEADKAIGYFDYSGEEIAIAAGLSGDQAMQKAYLAGDFYIEFAKKAGAVPADATKESHGFERSQYKVVALAVQYGGGAPNVASRLGISEDAARKLLDDHKRAFPDFNRWSWSLTERLGVMSSADGWTYRISRKGSKQTKSTTLKTFPCRRVASISCGGHASRWMKPDSNSSEQCTMPWPSGSTIPQTYKRKLKRFVRSCVAAARASLIPEGE